METREKTYFIMTIIFVISIVFIFFNQRSQISVQNAKIELLEKEISELEINMSSLNQKIAINKNKIEENEEYILTLQNTIKGLQDNELEWEEIKRQIDGLTLSNSKLFNILFIEGMIPCNFTIPSITPRKEEFRINDTIGFEITNIIPLYNSSITIWNPNGSLIWETDPLINWVYHETYWFVPVNGQTAGNEYMILKEESVTGEWKWAFRVYNNTYVDGSFMVISALESIKETGPDS